MTTRPVSELLPRFRPLFPYVSFNHVQSLVFDTMIQTNKPVVVSAPTGSGKTGVFELAIVKIIMDCERKCIYNYRIVYLAPTKALCSERRKDWDQKFSRYNLECIELTSDVTEPVQFKNVTKSRILLATPEKWDSITRSWNGQKTFLQSVRLLLIDEIHLINDGSRGATLEAVISRMKTIRSIIWPTEQDNLRFVGVSATVSNVRDIAEWFSSPEAIAEVYQVNPKERPVKLRTIVLGYSVGANFNEFSFDNSLNSKIIEVIEQYSNGKPTLIFCATRKSAQTCANSLARNGGFDSSFATERRRHYLRLSSEIRDTKLKESTRFGIAFHHAGLSAGDRRLIEQGFIDGSVMILCCTSTLALGVNLPAHLVIIKNTTFFDAGSFKPYSESTLVQMIGRAGRPQYDTEATAVIMTKTHCRDEIEKMLRGKLVIDSQLHKFLTEHLNSEIVLGTITNDLIARKWLDSTFLSVRVMKSPENYGLKKGIKPMEIEMNIIEWCKQSVELLVTHKIAKRVNLDQLEPTDAGRAMARNYISLPTMIVLLNLKGTESLWDLLQIVCACQEVVSDLQMRTEDRPSLNALLNPKDESLRLRFPLGDRIQTREKKAAALVQAIFGNATISENNLAMESGRVLKNASRVVNCLKEVSLMSNDINYGLLVNVVTLAQCFAARLWHDSIYVSKQLEKIGDKLSHNLAKNELISFEALRRANPRNIEIFCGRLPPFGSNVQQTCTYLPIYNLKITFRNIPSMKDKVQMMVLVTIENGQDLRVQQSLHRAHSCVLIVGCPETKKVLLRHQTVDAAILSRPDLSVCFGTDLDRFDVPNGEVEGLLKSETFVGLDARVSVRYIESEVGD